MLRELQRKLEMLRQDAAKDSLSKADDFMRSIEALKQTDEYKNASAGKRMLMMAEARKKSGAGLMTQASPVPKPATVSSTPDEPEDLPEIDDSGVGGDMVLWTPNERKQYSLLRNKGYEHHEAAMRVGRHTPFNGNMAIAYHSKNFPTKLSDAHRADLMPIVKAALDKVEQARRVYADEEKNPVLHAAGRLHEAVKDVYGGLQEKIDALKNSDEYKQASAGHRMLMVADVKKQHMKEAPMTEHAQKLNEIHLVHAANIHAARERGQDIRQQIARGGIDATPVQQQPEPPEEDDRSEVEREFAEAGGSQFEGGEPSFSAGIQHIGVGQEDKQGVPSVTSGMDPVAAFVMKNPHYAKHLSEQQMAKMKEVLGRRQQPTAQPAAPAPEAPKPEAPTQPTKPKTAIRRKGS